MTDADTTALLRDARICLTHWDQGVSYSPLVRASRRTADYPSRIAGLIADLARGVLPWSVVNCAPLFRDLDDGLVEWWAEQHGMIFPFGRLLHRARVLAARRGLAPLPILSSSSDAERQDGISFVPTRVGDQPIALLPAGAAREELWMMGFEDEFITHAVRVRSAMSLAIHPVVCESALAAWLLWKHVPAPNPVMPLALWLIENQPNIRLQCSITSPVVVQDSSCLSRLYQKAESVDQMLPSLPTPIRRPLRAGVWAVAASAEYEQYGLDVRTRKEIALRRYNELAATGARTIVTLEPYAAKALRGVASETVSVVSLREMVCVSGEQRA